MKQINLEEFTDIIDVKDHVQLMHTLDKFPATLRLRKSVLLKAVLPLLEELVESIEEDEECPQDIIKKYTINWSGDMIPSGRSWIMFFINHCKKLLK